MSNGRHRTSGGFAAILLGTGLGQIVTFFALPVLSRIYTPDAFGELSFALSTVAVLVPVSLLGFDLAVVRPKSDSTVSPLIMLAVAAVLTTGALTSVALIFSPITAGFSESARILLAWATPLLLVISGLSALFNQLAIRSGKYVGIGRRNGAQSISITAAQFAFAGPLRAGPTNGLILGNLLGSGIGMLLVAPYAKRYLRPVKSKELGSTVRAFWRFPMVFAPMSSLTLLAQQIPTFFALFYFGVTAGGQVGMAERLVAVPLALVGMAAGTVFTGELSNAVRTQLPGQPRLYLRASAMLLIPGAFALIGLALFAEAVIPFLLGSSWESAAQIAQAMAVLAATRMVTNPLRQVFRVLESAKALLIVEGLRLALLTTSIFISVVLQLDLVPSLTLLFLALAASDVVTWLTGLRILRRLDPGGASKL